MDKKRSIELRLAQDPTITNQELADDLGCSKRNVEVIVREFNLRKEEVKEGGKAKKARAPKEQDADAVLRAKVKEILCPALKASGTHEQRFVACAEVLELLAKSDGVMENEACLAALKSVHGIKAKHSKT